MSEFVWSEALRLGIKPMDRDHQIIIELMNALTQAVEREAGPLELKAAFSKLITFTRQHFQAEERYMESVKFARIDSHKLIHCKLLSELDQHFAEFNATGTIPDKVFRFLTFWLKSHICGIDMQYAKAAQQSQSAVTAPGLRAPISQARPA